MSGISVIIGSYENPRAFSGHRRPSVASFLSTIASYLQLLERRYEEELDEDAHEFIEFAESGATRKREMIDGLVTTDVQVESSGDSF